MIKMREEKVIVRKGGVGSLLSGFVIGGLIGAAVALLSAPQSGPETRQMLREKSTELKDQVVETAGQTRDRAEKVISNARGKVSEVANVTRERAAELLHREADMMEEGRKKVEQTADRIEGGNI